MFRIAPHFDTYKNKNAHRVTGGLFGHRFNVRMKKNEYRLLSITCTFELAKARLFFEHDLSITSI